MRVPQCKITVLYKNLKISGYTCAIKDTHGFLKYVCFSSKTETKFKCAYSDEYYSYNIDPVSFPGEICSNDSHYYQACDKRIGEKITNNDLLCEQFICVRADLKNTLYTKSGLVRYGICKYTCTNTELNKEACTEKDITLPTGRKARSHEICDGKCDDVQCEDEGFCHGYTYGIFCVDRWSKTNKLTYVPPEDICDGEEDCKDGKDEEDCEVTEETESSCRHIRTGEMVPVHNYTRCTGVDIYEVWDRRQYCEFSDRVKQLTNCSDPSRVGVTCEINGFKSNVSNYLNCFKINDTISACDDKIESKCLITNSCRIHKHYMCDNVDDCVDKADEMDKICNSTTKAACKRRAGRQTELPIPIAWIKDDFKDCENGVDEFGDWSTCGVGKRLRYVSSKEVECKNVFICRTGDPGYVELEKLCDGLETCGNENKICSVSNRPQSLAMSVPTKDKGLTKTLSYCLLGLSNLEHLKNVSCVTKQHLYPDEDIFGVTKTSVILPDNKVPCDHIYGEQYLYTSCTARCSNATCPLRNIPRYEVCPSQYPDRIGTIVNNEYLIFVTKSYESVYTNRYFVCDDKIKCIEYSKVCDLVYDCNDKSDEARCTNHFKCTLTEKLMPKAKKCDGQVDCFDFSDECNEQCSKEILEGYWLKGLSWIIGLLAIVANLVIIVKCIRTLKRCKTAVAFINRLLILVIALGDFFVGCYLFIIATFDGLIYRRGYCQQQIKWITSFECSVIGVFSTIGSQISLFAMTGLSIVRMYGIWNSMSIPGEVTLLKSLKIALAMMFLVLSSAVIAILPLVEMFEDYFVNGVKFSEEIKIFVGTSNKATLLEVIQAYYGRAKNSILDWKIAIQMIKDMFSLDLDYKDLNERVDKVDFYGNDGVCMFKYFVQNDDPQRLFVWGILSINFICFVFISLSYLLIGVLSRRSSESLASSKNRQIEKRNKRMNQKIAVIIATDFLCWVPFTIICLLHSFGMVNATLWYSVFSMVILPINSVINPLLYDDAVIKVFIVSMQAPLTRMSNSNAFRGVRKAINRNPASSETTMETPVQLARQPTRSGEEEAEAQATRQVSRESIQVHRETIQVAMETRKVPDEAEKVPKGTGKVHEETGEVDGETVKVSEETVKVPEETEKVHEEAGKVHEEAGKVSAETGKVSEETRKVHEEIRKVSEETGKVHEETGEVSEETEKVSEETKKVHEEIRRVSEETGKVHEETGEVSEETEKVPEETGKVSEMRGEGHKQTEAEELTKTDQLTTEYVVKQVPEESEVQVSKK